MHTAQRILLVDDNESDNVFHEIILRKAGFKGEINVFETGVDVLDFLRSDPLEIPTYIFLDINMPMMNGFEVAQEAAPLIEGKPTVILVMLTSSGSPLDRERAASLPVISGYLTKPLTVETALELLQRPL
ncbi:MAG: response regulator [Hydrogenophaga sp.]|nr:response regulator [Hydrogenophaga sp.]